MAKSISPSPMPSYGRCVAGSDLSHWSLWTVSPMPLSLLLCCPGELQDPIPQVLQLARGHYLALLATTGVRVKEGKGILPSLSQTREAVSALFPSHPQGWLSLVPVVRVNSTMFPQARCAACSKCCRCRGFNPTFCKSHSPCLL